MREGLIKFLLKVLDENLDRLVWEHFCYAPEELYLRYLKEMEAERFEMGDFVSRWAKEDFNVDLPMTTSKDIAVLKELIMDKYTNAYPHLLRKSKTDHQGWTRVWVSTHMDRDLQRRRPS